MATYSLATLPTPQAATTVQHAPGDASQQQQEMQQLLQQHERFFALVKTYFDIIPENIQLTQSVVDCHQQIIVEGKARTREDVIQFIEVLQTHGFSDLAQFKLHPTTNTDTQTCAFTLSVIHGTDQPSLKNQNS